MIGIIGDIHGCFNTLRELVNIIKSKYPGIELYSVGDLVDRGNFSCEVLDFIIEQDIKFTPGNHDYMFYYFMKRPDSVFAGSWLYNGYENTLKSYENQYEKLGKHLEFIKSAPLFFDLEDCFVSHAGISVAYRSMLPEKPINDTAKLEKIVSETLESESGILWTRDELLNIGKLQVVGHTRKNEILINEKSNAVYIDTSAYAGNKLTAVIIAKGIIKDTFSTPTNGKDVTSFQVN